MIRSLSTDGCLLWMRDMIADDLTHQAEKRDDLDAALLKCGINCKLSTESKWDISCKLFNLKCDISCKLFT